MPRGSGEVALPPHVPVKALNGLKTHRATIRQRLIDIFTPLGLHVSNLMYRGDGSRHHIEEAIVERVAKATLTDVGIRFPRCQTVVKRLPTIAPFTVTRRPVAVRRRGLSFQRDPWGGGTLSFQREPPSRTRRGRTGPFS